MKTSLTTFCLWLFIRWSAMGQGLPGNEETARFILDAFNHHNWERMMSYYAEDAVFEDPSLACPVKSSSMMLQHHRKLQADFGDIRDDVRHVYSCGSVVVVEFVSHGTARNGERFSVPICTVLTFRDGLVIRDATYYDVNR
jgi:ketosteroid isomerase-like protein